MILNWIAGIIRRVHQKQNLVQMYFAQGKFFIIRIIALERHSVAKRNCQLGK